MQQESKDSPGVLAKGKSQLLKATIAILAEKGFEKATTREIAAAAGMTTGALYHHYKNKEDLFYDAIKEAAYFVHRLSEVAPDQHLRTQAEMLDEISQNMIQRMSKETEQHLLVLLLGYALSKGGQIKAHYQSDYMAIAHKVGQMLQYTFGVFHSERQQVASSILIAALDGIAIQYALGVIDIHDQVFKEQFVQFFIQSIPPFLKGTIQ